MIAIINYGSGNISAISNIYKQLKVQHMVVDEPKALDNATHHILPGVGHFDYTMNKINKACILEALQENVVNKGKPLLGICVGMQVLADYSEEGDCEGLGWISGRVEKIRQYSKIRLPHMGWNSIVKMNDEQGLLKGIDETLGFYFLHSYQFLAAETVNVLATTEYGETLVCGITNLCNIFGLQFHPEKSHSNGIIVLKNFAAF